MLPHAIEWARECVGAKLVAAGYVRSNFVRSVSFEVRIETSLVFLPLDGDRVFCLPVCKCVRAELVAVGREVEVLSNFTFSSPFEVRIVRIEASFMYLWSCL